MVYILTMAYVWPLWANLEPTVTCCIMVVIQWYWFPPVSKSLHCWYHEVFVELRIPWCEKILRWLPSKLSRYWLIQKSFSIHEDYLFSLGACVVMLLNKDFWLFHHSLRITTFGCEKREENYPLHFTILVFLLLYSWHIL